MTKFRRITRTSLFARMSLLFGLLVTVPLVISGIVLSIAAGDTVNESGNDVAQIGTSAVGRQSSAFSAVANRKLQLASKAIADLSKQQVKNTADTAFNIGSQQFRENAEEMRKSGEIALSAATSKVVSLADAKLGESTRELQKSNKQTQIELISKFVNGMQRELNDARQQQSINELKKSLTTVWDVSADRRAAAVQDYAVRRISDIVLRLQLPMRKAELVLQNDDDESVEKARKALREVQRNWDDIIRVVLVSETGTEWTRVPENELPPNEYPDWTAVGTADSKLREQLFAKGQAWVQDGPRIDERTKKWIIRVAHKILPVDGSSDPTPAAATPQQQEAMMAMAMESRQPLPFIVVDFALDKLVESAFQDLKSDNTKQIFVIQTGAGLIVSSRSKDDGSASPRVLAELPTKDLVTYKDQSFSFNYKRQDDVEMKAQARFWGSEYKCWTIVAEPVDVILQPAYDLTKKIQEASLASLAKVRGDTDRFLAAKNDDAKTATTRRLTATSKAMKDAEATQKTVVAGRLMDAQKRLLADLKEGIGQEAEKLRKTAGEGIEAAAALQASNASAEVKREADAVKEQATDEIGRNAEQVASRAARKMLGKSAWLIPLFLILALFLATLTAKSLVRPINQLVKGAQGLGSGDYSQRIKIHGDDELARLAVAFNEMAGAIEVGQAELIQSHDSLAAEKTRIQGIVDSSPDGLVMLEPSGQVAFINPTAIALLNLKPEQVPAAPFELSALPQTVAQRLEECLETCCSQEGVQEYEFAEPQRRVLQLRGVQLRSAQGRSYGRLLHLHDITRERVIDEMKSDFISLVSHELRTPLTSILGFSSYMLTGRMGGVTETQKTALDSIHRQAKRLSAIISDFLDISRIESGRIEMKKEPVQMQSVARRVVEDLRPQANEKCIDVVAEVHEGPYPLVALGDEQRIAQVFTNLVGNALKFTEPEGRIEVSLARQNGELQCSVRDTGCGIPADELDRVFDRFYQVEKVVTRKSGGTGLGLAIVKNIVEAHGGRIWIESEIGHGTQVSFTLPGSN